jgi:N-formylglutamate amidohydrolase
MKDPHTISFPQAVKTEPAGGISPAASSAVIEIVRPKPGIQRVPLMLASPHSGHFYPPEFLQASQLDISVLRQSEDCYVDELIGAAPKFGVPVLKALFPRSFCDVNREPLELDPGMFEDALPREANIASPRIAAGLGVIPRFSANEREIYGAKMPFAEAERRLEGYYRPYHDALARLIRESREAFGAAILLDCHSMPSIGGAGDRDRGRPRVDFVLGDCFGAACAEAVIGCVEQNLRATGATVRRNNPYAGGYVTQHYGRPAEGVHVLQIEINRSLYVDEASLDRAPGFAALQSCMNSLIGELVGRSADLLRA